MGDGVEMLPPAGMEEFVEGRRALSLDHGQLRYGLDEAPFLQLPQRFAKGRCVAQVPAGQHNPVRHGPIALVEHLDDDGLLPFDAKRIDRIQQVNALAFGQDAHHRQDLVKVGFHLKCARTILQSLRQFSIGDVAVGNEDEGLESSGAGVSRHGSGSVAGGDAGHAPHAEPPRLRDSAGHPVVFERSGRIEALVLENQPVEPAIFRRLGRGEQGRVPFPERDHRVEILEKRDHLAIAPDTALIERQITGAARAPDGFHLRGIECPMRIARFEQAAAFRAVVEDLGHRELRAAVRLEAHQFGGHGFPIVTGRRLY
jgi:hypothetical protein